MPKGCFVPPDVLSPRTFCPHGCLVFRTYCPSGRFVLSDVLSLRTFCPTDNISLAFMSPDVFSRKFCPSGHFGSERFVWHREYKVVWNSEAIASCVFFASSIFPPCYISFLFIPSITVRKRYTSWRWADNVKISRFHLIKGSKCFSASGGRHVCLFIWERWTFVSRLIAGGFAFRLLAWHREEH